jgi:molecular chaperone DnaK (HSP70)
LHTDNQSSVSIRVFQGERARVADNHSLGNFELSGIAPAPRGVPQIEVSFDLDANGCLSVSAVDKANGNRQKITITNANGSLSKADIERMIADEARFKDEDAKVMERQEVRQKLEQAVYGTQTMLDQKKAGIPESERDELERVLGDCKEWLDANPKASVEELRERQQQLQAAMMKLSGASSGAASNGDSVPDAASSGPTVEEVD